MFELNKIYPEHEVYMLTKNIHHSPEDFEDGDIGERIERYENYKLMNVPLSLLDRGGYMIDEYEVEEFCKKDINTMPPIVLGDFYSNKFDVVDGNHRVESSVIKECSFIKSFVPLELVLIVEQLIND